MLIPSEHQEQCLLIEWAGLQTRKYPELALLYAIPNGGERNKIVAAKLKAEGVKSGVPDLCLPVARGIYHGLYIEMKRKKGGETSQNQGWWIDQLENQGFRAVVCKGFEAAQKAILDYFNLKMGDYR